MAPNQLLIGKSAFIVRAQSLPNGYNQRPGMTLLLADGEPLELEIDGLPAATSEAWLLAPEIRRRFLRPQPHTSITVEPSHPSYLRMLRWARSSPDAALRVDVPVASRFRLASATTQQTFDDALNELLALHEQPEITPSPRLGICCHWSRHQAKTAPQSRFGEHSGLAIPVPKHTAPTGYRSRSVCHCANCCCGESSGVPWRGSMTRMEPPPSLMKQVLPTQPTCPASACGLSGFALHRRTTTKSFK